MCPNCCVKDDDFNFVSIERTPVPISTMTRFKIFILAAIVCSISYLSGCNPIALKWQFQETQRIESPDKEVEAVLIKGDAGAVSPTDTLVVVVPAGSRIDTNNIENSYDVIFRAN